MWGILPQTEKNQNPHNTRINKEQMKLNDINIIYRTKNS